MNNPLDRLRPGAEWLQLSDEEIAYHFVAWAMAMAAEKAGVPVSKMNRAAALVVMNHLKEAEMPDVRVAALEKGLKKIAQGDPFTGGKILREFLLDGAHRMYFERLEEQRQERLAAGRDLMAAARTKYHATDRAEWLRLASLPEILKFKSNSDKARAIIKRLEADRGGKFPDSEQAGLEQAIRKALSKAIRKAPQNKVG
jgi:hypothetical protein